MTRCYADLVDSGQTYLGRVPSHWHLSPLGSHFDERSENVSDADFPPLSVTKSGVVPRLETAAKSDNNDNRKLVRIGDFAINSRSDRKGSSGVSELEGSVSLVYTVLKPRSSVDGRFAHHLLRSTAFQEEFYRWGNGIVDDLWTTRYSAMKRIQLALPPPEEQRAIAAYLDRETTKIDTLIAKQGALISALRERRASLITTAATRGVAQHSLTDAGDPFLGDVPADWTVNRFRRVLTINGGQIDPTDEPWIDTVLVAPNHIEGGTGRIVGRETAREQAADSGKCVVKQGQIVYSKIRPVLNKVARAKEDCICSADMYAMSPIGDDDPAYLVYQMLSRPFHTFATVTSMRVKMPKINREELADAPILQPPLHEQREIVAFLDEQTEKIDQLILLAARFVELAKERRAALITAAVTGQIDVREVA